MSANHVTNLTPTSVINKETTPFEILHDEKPESKYLRLFGCVCYTHVLQETGRNKLDHSLACENNLLIHQMDVQMAFLNGELQLAIYMNVPEEMEGLGDHVLYENSSLARRRKA